MNYNSIQSTMSSCDLDVEALVRKAVREIAMNESGSDPMGPWTKNGDVVSLFTVQENKNATDANKSCSRRRASKLESKKMRKRKKPSSTKEKKRKSKDKSNKKQINIWGKLFHPLFTGQKSPKVAVEEYDVYQYNVYSSVSPKTRNYEQEQLWKHLKERRR